MAEGVADGLKHGGPINVNKASEKDLETLPGIDEAIGTADCGQPAL